MPTIGIAVVVSRDPRSIIDRSDLGPDVCDDTDVAGRLHRGERAVVVLTIARLGESATLSALAKQVALPITALLDASTLSPTNISQADRTLLNVGVSTRLIVAPCDRVESAPPAFDRRHLHGPFDIIGDIHGCIDELRELLTLLGYYSADDTWTQDDGRTIVFVGDLTDRGPDSPAVLELVLELHNAGISMLVIGNHDDKLLRYLGGANVKAAHGLALTIEQLQRHHDPDGLSTRTQHLLAGAPDHLLLDGGQLVVAHAGLPEPLHGKISKKVRAFALYGDVTGATDDDGYPVRRNWATHYHGTATVVHGHVVVKQPTRQNNVIDIDTGCVFGGTLTALRWPEDNLVSVPARSTYWVGTTDR